MNADAKRMTALLATAGVTHLVRPAPFDAIVPPQLGNPRFWTYASGVAELSCAALIANPGTRRIGGTAAAALMVAVYPANLYMVKKYWHSPAMRAVSLARLPLQIPLIRRCQRIARGGTGA